VVFGRWVEGDELLFGVVGDLEDDVFELELAEGSVPHALDARRERGYLVSRPPLAYLTAQGVEPVDQILELRVAGVPRCGETEPGEQRAGLWFPVDQYLAGDGIRESPDEHVALLGR
jgi:hypothetical protein